MPSYCSAVNCKNNGISHPELSFFRFPENRKDINEKWIEAMHRVNWTPTKYSRVCSIHFDDNCFFLKKGSRLRLLPDAVPTIFDFRKLKNNRKKAEHYIDMTESDCPDPNMYQLEMEPVLAKTAKSGQKCFICQGLADCDITLDSTIITKIGKLSLFSILSTFSSVTNCDNKSLKFICMSCSRRLIDSHLLKCDILKNPNLPELSPKNNGTHCEEDPHATKSSDFKIKMECNQDIAYCSPCDRNFFLENIAEHLRDCKMKDEADRHTVPIENRRLIVCHFCRYLFYQHNAEDHQDVCSKITDIF